MRAYNEAGTGEWSKGKAISTNEGVPGVPINLVAGTATVAEAVTGSAITLHWDIVDGATSYEVEVIDGIVYASESNTLVIANLEPGVKYDFHVRALNEGGAGAWSSRVSYVPIIAEPMNVKASLTDSIIQISWDIVGGAEYYEVELNGVVFTTTETNSVELPFANFYMERTIRVRACDDMQKSEWSESELFSQAIPVTIEVTKGEEFSILLPVNNSDISKYKLTIVYNVTELQLLDACEMTSEEEVETVYLENLDTHLIIVQNGEENSISFIIQAEGRNNWTGVAASIRFISKINGTATLKYGVTSR